MGETIHEPARELPVISDVDICVLGGSATGVFAAVRAARLGAKVAIVERLNRFGGMATAALVNVWHSLYDEVHERKIIAGLTHETMDRLATRNAVENIDRNPNQAFIFNSAELATELDQLVVESGIEPHLHTAFAAPLVEDGNLVGIAVENKSGRGAIRARMFVDATGD
ncbi:MAG TPA: FAD-dependent oxidoreductase, partial [Firmicutes bacterium]|nr:FAD-dependent oxidoreductase [Bacillota bacterium]